MIGPKRALTLKRYFPQLVTGFGVTMVVVQIGVAIGWSSPYIAQLTTPDSPLLLTTYEASWVASLLNFGRFFGAMIGAVFLNYFGSKKTVLLILIPMIACWTIMICANDAWWLYIARFFSGLSSGITYLSFPLYLGEVSLPEIRGSLISLAVVGVPFGVMISSVSGSYLSLKIFSGIYLAPCIVLMILFIWLPESPHHLAKVGKLENARKSIEWYRAGWQVDEEFEAVKKFVSDFNSTTFIEKFKSFREPALARAIILVIILWALQQTSGVNSVFLYMETILTDGGLHIIKPNLVVVYVNAVAIIFAICSVVMIERCGRRLLLIVSSLGVTISMIGLGMHFFLIDRGIVAIQNLQWLILASMFLYTAFFYIGLLSVPSTIVSELFPTKVKCTAACFASLSAAIFSFAVAKSYQPMIEMIGHAYVFYLHAGLTFLIVPYTLLCMPETKGKSLRQIQDDLIKN